MNPLSILKYVFSVVGLALLAATFYLYSNTNKFIEKANFAKGKVVELIVYENSDGNTYRPIVLFTTKEGKNIKFSTSGSSNPAVANLGETVEVLYDPLDPNKAKINKFFSLWFASLVSGILGTIFSFVGFSVFYLEYKKKDVKISAEESKYVSFKI